MTPLYVMTYLPNLERLMMLPDISACEEQPLYVMEYVPSWLPCGGRRGRRSDAWRRDSSWCARDRRVSTA